MGCGSKVMVRSCGACGSARSGSGTYEGTKSCKVKACPFCSWVRAKRVGDFFGRAFELLEHEEHRWQMAVVTFPYDPEADATVADLRARAIRAGRVGSFLWKAELKQEGAGLYRHTEISVRGHVHLNLLYFGPPLDQTALEHLVQTSAHADDVGSIHLQNIDYVHRPKAGTKGFREAAEDPRGSQEGLRRAAEYIAKGMDFGAGTGEEAFLADQARVMTIDPILAARWDIATLGVRLSQKSGALYGLKLTETTDCEPHEHVDDSDTTCGDCGVVGDWRTTSMRSDRYILGCHALGVKALVSGRWIPPPDG
jgi:hypothetical protein